MYAMNSCPFCSVATAVLAENEHAFSIEDRRPVSQGHSLIIPKAHVASIFDLSQQGYVACFDLLRNVKDHITKTHHPAGFNVGINCGVAAGQTVPHAHIHLIPRYEGDVEKPGGGVRNIIPGKGED